MAPFGPAILERPLHSRNNTRITEAVLAIAAVAEFHHTSADFPTGAILQYQLMDIVAVPTVVPRCRQRGSDNRRGTEASTTEREFINR